MSNGLSNLSIMEAIRLRVKDLDFGMKQITVRSGKGDKDRITTLPLSLTSMRIRLSRRWQRQLRWAMSFQIQPGKSPQGHPPQA